MVKHTVMRKRKGNKIDGWINLDKPYGMSSTQALGAVKRILHPQKAGHAGTLDPLATGVLPIALGEATKTIPYAQDREKTYSFTVRWGERRSTDDAEGEVIATSSVRPTAEQIEGILPRFTGEIEQVPPQFSAIKINGERAYDLARAGETVEIKSRIVFIESLDLVESLPDEARFRTVCGKGTYMRSLARDMAIALGTEGYISALRREAVGPFDAGNMISLDKLEKMADSAAPEDAVLPVQTALDDIPALALEEREAVRLKGGNPLTFMSRPEIGRLEKAGIDLKAREPVTVLALLNGRAVALVSVKGVEIQPLRVLNL